MKISGIPTPALILDVHKFQANAEKMKKLLDGTQLHVSTCMMKSMLQMGDKVIDRIPVTARTVEK